MFHTIEFRNAQKLVKIIVTPEILLCYMHGKYPSHNATGDQSAM